VGSLGRIHHEASAVDGASRADAAVFDHPLLDGPVVDFLQADAVEAGDECQELLLRQAADDVVPGLEAEPVLDGDVLDDGVLRPEASPRRATRSAMAATVGGLPITRSSSGREARFSARRGPGASCGPTRSSSTSRTGRMARVACPDRSSTRSSATLRGTSAWASAV